MSGRRGVRVGATSWSASYASRGGLRTLVRRSVRCLKSSGATWVVGSQAKARTFVCARCPDRRAASTRQTGRGRVQRAVAISQQAPMSSRARQARVAVPGAPRRPGRPGARARRRAPAVQRRQIACRHRLCHSRRRTRGPRTRHPQGPQGGATGCPGTTDRLPSPAAPTTTAGVPRCGLIHGRSVALSRIHLTSTDVLHDVFTADSIGPTTR